MSYRVLVIGGSYFLGRVFTMTASQGGDMDLTLINRGTYSMAHLPGVKELRRDRHRMADFPDPAGERFDAVVDFCAYRPGEARSLLEHLRAEVGQYILISTADVYDRVTPGQKTESAPLWGQQPPGPAGEYIFGKVLLERESAELCAQRGMGLTVLRPAFVYGPYNYAPREAYYIERAVKGLPLPLPVDSRARFQFVYVKDAAEAILRCVREPAQGLRALNLAAPELVTYASFLDTLSRVSDCPVRTEAVTVEQVLRDDLPLPFPLTPEEDELFSGEAAAERLGLRYTPFEEGMARTFRAFAQVYR